ncbi:MAG: hypothetical protein HQL08_00230 [Nitrospirae bacterium]|nr:hypothetical protein [Nitrospirota bacterium]
MGVQTEIQFFNKMNRDMLSRRLQRKGYDITMAVDGEQGVNIARKEKAMDAECDDYDSKAIEFQRLLGKIEYLLNRKSAA